MQIVTLFNDFYGLNNNECFRSVYGGKYYYMINNHSKSCRNTNINLKTSYGTMPCSFFYGDYIGRVTCPEELERKTVTNTEKINNKETI